jgi:hypothetical protein
MNFYNYNRMKRIIIISVSLVSFAFQTALSQGTGAGLGQNREKLNAYRIAFFTQKLDLTVKEAEKFWPLYNSFQEEKMKIQTERAILYRKFNQGNSTLSDKEMVLMGDKLMELQTLDSELIIKFHQQVKEILPPVKVLKLYQAENQYKQVLLNELQLRRPEEGNQPRRLQREFQQ